jgi:hypothetical protein
MTDVIAGNSQPAAIWSHWQQRYQARLSDNLGTLDSKPSELLILVQPRAFAPVDLVRIDNWVRGGGRAVILTDPELVWPSDLPFGDPRRPQAIGMLSPLLQHWGLELQLGETPITSVTVHSARLPSSGVGQFALASQGSEAQPKCRLSPQRTEATCRIGAGQVILIADADFIHDTFVQAGSPALEVLDDIIADLLQ